MAMRKINPAHQRVIDEILAVPGVTQQILDKAIYQWRQKQGYCSRPLNCKNKRMTGSSQCEYHSDLARAASERHFKKAPRA